MNPTENPESIIESSTVWDRLRVRISEMQSLDPRTDPVLLAERLQQRARSLRSRPHSDVQRGAMLGFLAFQKGRQRFGIPTTSVLEVLGLDHVSPVPWTPEFVCGAVHWRGTIITLLDLVKLFGIAESGITDAHSAIIVEAAGHRVAILSGEIDELYTVPVSDLRTPPELPGDVPSEWLLGVHDETRMILHMDAILQDARVIDWRNQS